MWLSVTACRQIPPKAGFGCLTWETYPYCVSVCFFFFLELSTFWTQCLETLDACVYFSSLNLPLHLMKVLRLNLIKHEEFHEENLDQVFYVKMEQAPREKNPSEKCVLTVQREETTPNKRCGI